MAKIADVVFLTRPPLLCASSTFFFAGAVSALGSNGEYYSISRIVESLPNLALFILVVGAAFVVNQIFDVESDRLNKKVYLIPSGVVSKREGVLVLGVIVAVTLGLSLLYSPEVRYLSWLGLGLAFAYSVPPIRLKAKPILDILANVIGFGVVGFAMGWLTYSDMGTTLWVKCSPYALAMGGIFLITCIPDEEGDRLLGDHTSCVVLGRVTAGRAAVLLTVVSAVVGVASGEMLCALAVLGGLPAVVAVGVEPDSSNSVMAGQLAARLLLALVSVRAPLLAVLTAVTYFGSRAYYKKRFGLRYPDLKGAAEIGPFHSDST